MVVFGSINIIIYLAVSDISGVILKDSNQTGRALLHGDRISLIVLPKTSIDQEERSTEEENTAHRSDLQEP